MILTSARGFASSIKPRDRQPAHFELPPAHFKFPPVAAMGRRKGKNKSENITKIDPSTLNPKPFAVSQHAANDGTRVTTVVKPIHQPPTSQADLANTFSADVQDSEGEHLEDDGGNDDLSRGYYVTRVCIFIPSFYA